MLQLGHLRVHLETSLEWESYAMRQPPLLIMGRESYPQLVYAIQVKPNVLESDPGPLDARVP
jgi:hypothetical protein